MKPHFLRSPTVTVICISSTALKWVHSKVWVVKRRPEMRTWQKSSLKVHCRATYIKRWDERRKKSLVSMNNDISFFLVVVGIFRVEEREERRREGVDKRTTLDKRLIFPHHLTLHSRPSSLQDPSFELSLVSESHPVLVGWTLVPDRVGVSHKVFINQELCRCIEKRSVRL